MRSQSTALNPRAVAGQAMQSRAVLQARFLGKCSQTINSFKVGDARARVGLEISNDVSFTSWFEWFLREASRLCKAL